jgi:hypothetical protein
MANNVPAPLLKAGFTFMETGIDLRGKLIDKKTWKRNITFLGRLLRATPWMLGKLINSLEVERGKSLADLEKEKRRGDLHWAYQFAADETGYSIERIKHIAQVQRRVPEKDIFRELSFAHYETLLARIGNPARKKWAMKAIKNRWTAVELWQAYNDARLEEMAAAPLDEVDETIGDTKLTKEEEALADMNNIPTGISYEDIKAAFDENRIRIFEVLLDGSNQALEDESFLEGRSVRQIKDLLHSMRNVERYLSEYLRGMVRKRRRPRS